MSSQYTYLIVDLLCLAGPLLLSFYPKFRFDKYWKHFIIPCLFIGALFIGWDILYTYWGVWGFNHEYTLGIRIAGLPVEEYMFFICIPFACVFTYHAFTKLFDFKRASGFIYPFYIVLGIILLIGAALNTDRLYTVATFFLLGIILLVFATRKAAFLPAFFFSFLFILIPFFISNGVLTGSFLDRTIVYYNDEENLGIRMLTIPFEDMFYGMLLLILNVYGYELSLKASSNNPAVDRKK